MIYPNKPLYLLSLLGYVYYLTYYTLTTKDNIFFLSTYLKLGNNSLCIHTYIAYISYQHLTNTNIWGCHIRDNPILSINN